MLGNAFGFIKGKFFPGKGAAEETPESDKKEDQLKEPEAEQPAPKPKKSLKDKIKDKFGSLKDKFSGEKKKFNDSDGDGDRDGNARDRIKEQDEKAKANKKDPLKADLKAKYGEKRGLDTLMEMASGLFGQLKDGLGSIIGGALNIFSGKGVGGDPHFRNVRLHTMRWKSAPLLASSKKKPYPLAIFDLYDLYNLS